MGQHYMTPSPDGTINIILRSAMNKDSGRTIDKWCDIAHRRKLWQHKKHFWRIRDFLDGINIDIVGDVQFLDTLPNSEDKRTILDEIRHRQSKNDRTSNGQTVATGRKAGGK